MDKLRSSIADWITIITGLSTLMSGFASVYFNKVNTSTEMALDPYLSHILMIIVIMMSFLFFMNISLIISRKAVREMYLELPEWIIYFICFLLGLMFLLLIEVLVQSFLFNEFSVGYLVVTCFLWFITLFVFLIQ